MRDPYWDILKGLGIIFVVMGHASILTREVNWFHLELFFFVSGFFLNPKKCTDYGEFFLHKLKTLWKPFVLYNVVFFVLHDFFICINWITTSPKVGAMVADWIALQALPYLFLNVIFTGLPETMCLPTWFIDPFFINILLFAYLVKVTCNKPSWQLPVLLTVFFVVGVVLINYSPRLPMYFDMAMFLLPITAAGFYLKKFCSEKNIKVSEVFSTRIAAGGGYNFRYIVCPHGVYESRYNSWSV